MQNIEKLVSQSEKIENSLLKEALADLNKETREKQKKALIRALDSVNQLVNDRVRHLRDIRKLEKAAKEELVKVANGRDQFLKDADVEKFANAVHGPNTRQAMYFIQQFADLKDGR